MAQIMDKHVEKDEEDSPLLGTAPVSDSSGTTATIDKNTPLSTIFLILNVMIGAGFLVQPFVFKQAGIFTATILYALFACACFEAAELLVYLAKLIHIFDFATIVFYSLGATGAVVFDLSIIGILGGSVLSYTLLLGSLSSTIVSQWSTTTAWYQSAVFCTTIWVVFIILPFSLVRHLGHLSVVAYYSMAVVFLTSFLIMAGGPVVYGLDLSDIDWVTSSTTSNLSAIGSILFAMAYIPAVLPAYQSATKSTQRHFNHYLLLCSAIGALLYYFLGLMGYLTFGNSVNVDILENFSGYWAFVFQLAICMHLALIVPGYLVLIRMSLSNLVRYISYYLVDSSRRGPITIEHYAVKEDESGHNDAAFYALTVGMLLLIYLTAISLQLAYGGDSSTTIAKVVNIVGGVAGSIEVFIIPGLCGVALLQPTPAAPLASTSSSGVAQQHSHTYGTTSTTSRGDDKLLAHVLGYHRRWSYALVVLGALCMVLVTIGTALS